MSATRKKRTQVTRTAAPRQRRSLSSWVRGHLDACGSSLRQLAGKPAGTLATVIVIAIALSMPAGLQILLTNVERLAAPWNKGASISMFLESAVDADDIAALQQAIAARPAVREVTHITKQQALAELRSQEGISDIAGFFDENPLPDVLIVVPVAAVAGDPEELAGLRTELAAMPEVAETVLDSAWVQRLAAITDIARQSVILFVVVLAAGITLIIGNTIRLNISQRQDEIAIAKLVGATDGYTRRPFLYSGAWQGLLGGAGAWLIVTGGEVLLSPSIHKLAQAYGVPFELIGLNLGQTLMLLFGGALLGLIGAVVAVGRFLRDADRLLES